MSHVQLVQDTTDSVLSQTILSCIIVATKTNRSLVAFFRVPTTNNTGQNVRLFLH